MKNLPLLSTEELLEQRRLLIVANNGGIAFGGIGAGMGIMPDDWREKLAVYEEKCKEEIGGIEEILKERCAF